MANNYSVPPSPTYASSPPHFERPLAAPRPQKLIPDLPANMAHSLDQHLPSNTRSQRIYNPTPGFAMPTPDHRSISPMPPPQGSDWSPRSTSAPDQQPYHQPFQSSDVNVAFNNMSLANNEVPARYSPPRDFSSNPSLTAPIPNVQTLTAAIPSMQAPSFDPARKVVWCRDTFFLVDHLNQLGTNSPEIPTGPVHIEDPQLLQLTQIAIPIILSISSPQPMPNQVPAHVAEAIYIRATLASSGAYPHHIPLNPRVAFRDFEQAARLGYAPAWFKLGRDYESFGDDQRAKTCFERGVKHGEENCLYRMGMAHLMGQLGLPDRPDIALPLLHRAATLATLHVAQPAYVYGLLLLNKFSHVSIPSQYFAAVIPPNSSPMAEARKYLERAAYLNFSPAQYKLGHAYEFAEAPFPFDALLSVQYYSLASQQGEIEADMALSKWFLCGAEGAFEKDEGLAFTFAEKAARKGLPSAEFALGYYAEVGVGGPKDIEAARKWYTRAMHHGNADASERLAVLSQPAPQSLSRQEHDTLTDIQLVRKRTQAKQRSEAITGRRTGTSAIQGQKVMEALRKNSLAPSPISQPVNPVHAMPLAVLSSGPAPNHRRPAATERSPSASTPPLLSNPAGRPTNEYPPGQQPLPGGNKSFSGAQRFSLTDPGSHSGSPSTKVQAPSRPGPGPGPGGRPQPSSSLPPPHDEPPVQANPGKHLQTFQDMGIHTTKLEDKECIIM